MAMSNLCLDLKRQQKAGSVAKAVTCTHPSAYIGRLNLVATGVIAAILGA
jgi:hypothetical protein